jgi:hypothetical protein
MVVVALDHVDRRVLGAVDIEDDAGMQLRHAGDELRTELEATIPPFQEEAKPELHVVLLGDGPRRRNPFSRSTNPRGNQAGTEDGGPPKKHGEALNDTARGGLKVV